MTLTFTNLHPTGGPVARLQTGLAPLDRATGGGFVFGTTCLLSGEPGAGKSTLLLQVAAHAAANGFPAAYLTAEEALDQVQARAQRLGVANAHVKLAATDDLTAAIATLTGPMKLMNRPGSFLVVDSIQRMRVTTEKGEPGTPRQGRAAMRLLIQTARENKWIVVIVCHVVKGGGFAGPKAFEHDVDLAVQLTAWKHLREYRNLNVIKNRYGETPVELLMMTQKGMQVPT